MADETKKQSLPPTTLEVLLLIPDEKGWEDYANKVCNELKQRFDISNVLVGSANVPMEELTTRVSMSSTTSLLVALGPSTLTTAALEHTSSIPLLTLLPTATTPPSSSSSDPAHTALQVAKWCSLSSVDIRNRVEKAYVSQRQSRLVLDAQMRTRSPRYASAIANCYDNNSTITGDGVNVPGRCRGKVRDRYERIQDSEQQQQPQGLLALVTTDRQSGFDRMLAQVPYKGAVLNLTSAFWFDKTSHIIPNHLVAVPHPYVSIVRKCKPFPIEFVMRSYMTGSTSTSIWKNYQDGVRNYCGHDLPDGMVKNQKLSRNLLTPTTKEEEHDRPISLAEIVNDKYMDASDLEVCAKAAHEIFALGQSIAYERGLILVDTKYEFGKDDNGTIMLIDEVHTPDSSRYWLASTYEQRIVEGKEPDNIDKEFLRLWFRDHCDPYNDEVLPDAPRDLVLELARRYVTLFEMITGKKFDFDVPGEEAITAAIQTSL